MLCPIRHNSMAPGKQENQSHKPRQVEHLGEGRMLSPFIESLKVGVEAWMLPCVSIHLVALGEMGLRVYSYEQALLRRVSKIQRDFQVHCDQRQFPTGGMACPDPGRMQTYENSCPTLQGEGPRS